METEPSQLFIKQCDIEQAYTDKQVLLETGLNLNVASWISLTLIQRSLTHEMS